MSIRIIYFFNKKPAAEPAGHGIMGCKIKNPAEAGLIFIYCLFIPLFAP